MTESRGNPLASPFIKIVADEWQGGCPGAHDAAGAAVAHDPSTCAPSKLLVSTMACSRPEMDAAFFQVIGDERQMLIAQRIAADAPFEAVARQMAVAQQDSVQSRVVFIELVD